MKDRYYHESDLTEYTACDLIISLWNITESAKKIESVIFEETKKESLIDD